MELNTKKLKPVIQGVRSTFTTNQLENEITIFLCGGASKGQADFRRQLGKRIESLRSKYKYRVYQPETLFSEVANGHNSLDLLSLENVLANCVNSIVIPLESVGTFTELGAFANDPKLQDKLVILIRPKYRTANSFVNYGPIKKLKKLTSSKILYLELDESELDNIAYRVTDAARAIAEKFPLSFSLENPLKAMFYFLSLIFAFDPITKDDVLRVLSHQPDRDALALSLDTSLSNLTNRGYIELDNAKRYTISSSGLKRYLEDFGYSAVQKSHIQSDLANLRVAALNGYYRK